MRKGLYVVFDNKAGENVGMIIEARAEAVAIRTFADIVLMPDGRIKQHPADYELLKLADVTYTGGEELPDVKVDVRTILTAEQVIAAQNSQEGK